MMTNTLIQKAQNREGVFFQIVTADDEMSSFHPFPFGDDPALDAEEIAKSITTELMKFFVENGFYTSSDNKTYLGKV
jgi:hypothetical protein